MADLRSYAELARDLLPASPAGGAVRVVAIDGRAGSGKTTFARRLAGALGGAAQVLHTDDLLESGWEDLRGFWPQLHRVLDALEVGEAGSYLRYDWAAGRLGAVPVTVPVSPVLLVDGVSAAAATSGRRVLAVRVEAPADVRLARGVARDGEALRARWLQWMVQEDGFFSGDRPDPADVVVDGTAEAADEHRYVARS